MPDDRAAPAAAIQQELAAEQRYLDAAYERLDAMRRSAARVAEGYADVQRGGTHQARLERDVAEAYTRRRLSALDIGDTPLCFGRLDLDPARHRADGGAAAPYYIGRISVTDEALAPLVVDWRAPVAEPFYRATAIEPMGVARRRHFHTRGRELVGIDDEVFDDAAATDAGFAVVGEGALLAALERTRTGRMHDIVATIQAEQDAAIRAPLQGVLVVSGGPGTGKTAVALHRAAYLLYTHRRRLASSGVLLVGPSSIFLRYIDQVLPSLGEDEVVLATPAALKGRLRVGAVESAAVAVVKGDARMAKVVAAAARDRERPLPRDVATRLDGYPLRMRRRDSVRLLERVRGRRGTHNERRPYVTSLVIDHFRREYRRALIDAYRRDQERLTSERDVLGSSPAIADVNVAALLSRGDAAPREWESELAARLRRLPEIKAILERIWPVLSGAELVHDLLGFEALVRSAARGVLNPEEQRVLARPRSSSVTAVSWTEADLALIDEADALLGPTSAARPHRRQRTRRGSALDDANQVVAELGIGDLVSGADVLARYGQDDDVPGRDDGEPRVFGHVLVDEAQDLSGMQWRMLARRCPSGSMTLVGDFGQASRPGALGSWDAVFSQLPGRSRTEVVTLSVNYRTPAEIMDVANRLLAAAAPGVAAARPVRATGAHPEVVDVGEDELVRRAADAARRHLAEGGTVAVIAADELHATLAASSPTWARSPTSPRRSTRPLRC